MKRLLGIILSLVMCFSLCSCGAKPETVVTSFCDAMKNFDYVKMQEYVEDAEDKEETGDETTQENDSVDEQIKEELRAYFTECANKMVYTVVNTETNEDTAKVTVEFEYTDLSPLMASVMQEYVSQALIMAFSGVGDDGTYDQLVWSIFKEKAETFDPLMTSETVDFACHKVDGEWKISEMPAAVENIMTGNIQEMIDSNGAEESSSDEAMPTDGELINIYAEAMRRIHDYNYGGERDYSQTTNWNGMPYVKLITDYDTTEKIYDYYREVLSTDLAKEIYTSARSNLLVQDDGLYIMDADGGYLSESENVMVLDREDSATFGEINMVMEVPCGDSYYITNVSFVKEDGVWKLDDYYDEW